MGQLWALTIWASCGYLQYGPVVGTYNMVQLWALTLWASCGHLQYGPVVGTYNRGQLWALTIWANCEHLQYGPIVNTYNIGQLWALTRVGLWVDVQVAHASLRVFCEGDVPHQTTAVATSAARV